MVFRKNNGLTMIELIIVLAILSVFILVAIFTYLGQLAKGRDAKRKADLDKTQNVLEDYLNDKICYPDGLTCGSTAGTDMAGYISEVPCDPINNTYYNYFYSYDGRPEVVCKSWYKIYTKLENTKDPIIEKVGCANGCGPSNNYNYWVSSPNMNQVKPIAGAEDWWPTITGVSPPPGATPTSPPEATPTPSPTPGASPTPSPTPGASPTPTPTPAGNYYGCFSGVCTSLPGPICEPNYLSPDCYDQCVYPQNECK